MEPKDKYELHTLEFIRNNGIAETAIKDVDAFFMLDYFDVLYHKTLKGEQKQYETYFGIGDTFTDWKNYKSLYKFMSLYQETQRVKNNPFSQYEKEGLSDVPFIGIIQITLCKENYKTSPNGINAFLCSCEDKILDIVSQNIDNNSNVEKIQLYRSSSTADFCLVLRSDSAESIYKISLALNNAKRSSKSPIFLYAYTNIGIESKYENNSYCSFNKLFIQNHKMNYALRFSTDHQIDELYNYYTAHGGTLPFESAQGLFGKYNITLSLNEKDFGELYPLLCEIKLGSRNITLAQSSDNNITGLNCLIRRYLLHNINERIMIHLSPANIKEDATNSINEQQDYILKQNEDIFNKISELQKLEIYFYNEHRAFTELLRCTKEISKTFLPLGMEDDTYINWLIFCQDIETLHGCIIENMKWYIQNHTNSTEAQNTDWRNSFLENWRGTLDAISHYTEMVQNVNYQTYQSPIYEIQTQIDTEKMMIAYREAMENYLSLHSSHNNSTDEQKKPEQDKILVLIYPKLDSPKVQIKAPFSLSNFVSPIKRQIICEVPSFEYFGRMYDLLPWISHESSHSLRILNRIDRNTFWVNFIVQNLAKIIISTCCVKAADNQYYPLDSFWKRTLIQAFSDSWIDIAFPLPNIKDKNYENLSTYIDNEINTRFYEQNEYELDNTTKHSTTKKIIGELFSLAQGNQIVDDKLLHEFEIASQNNHNAKDAVQLIISKILDSLSSHFYQNYNYITNNKTFQKSQLIQKSDLYLPVDFLDNKLVALFNNIAETSPENNVVRDYCYSVKKLHYLNFQYNSLTPTENNTIDYNELLVKTYTRYKKNTEKIPNYLIDPQTNFILRNLGLLNDDLSLFYQYVSDCLAHINPAILYKAKEFYGQQYREISADILMSASLDLTSFGYCRQVLQTIADTKQEPKEYFHDSIEYDRFRVVTAVLLSKEGNIPSVSSEEYLKINAQSIINQGILYCGYSLKCLEGLIMQRIPQSHDKEKELTSNLLASIYSQIKYFLSNLASGIFKDTLIYAILHKNTDIEPELLHEMNKYSSILGHIKDKLYLLKRIECFCTGIEQIIIGNYISVPKNLFYHFSEIWDQAKQDSPSGCSWEKDTSPELLKPKMNVGSFFNNPELVQKLSSIQKLENTIDFIQSYYYHNRFRKVNELNPTKEN